MKKSNRRSTAIHGWIRALQILFWLNVVALVAVTMLVFLGRFNSRVRELLIEARSSVLTHVSSDFRLLELTPTGLDRIGFLNDSPAALGAWRANLQTEIPEIVKPIEAAAASGDDIATARSIVRGFSAGGHTGELIYWMDWPQKIRAARRGAGLCSDHTKIFQALAKIVGLDAREVQNGVHSYLDFFSASRGKWIFVDPQYAIMAVDGSGAYVSSVELRYRRLHNQSIRFEFFGTDPNQIHGEGDIRFQRLYGDATVFERYILTNGNNLATQASISSRFASVPWEARELFMYLSRRRPGYVQFVDEFGLNDRRPEWRGTTLIFAFLGFYVVGLVSYPLIKAAERLCGKYPATEQ
jgi:hypothetical protein